MIQILEQSLYENESTGELTLRVELELIQFGIPYGLSVRITRNSCEYLDDGLGHIFTQVQDDDLVFCDLSLSSEDVMELINVISVIIANTDFNIQNC